MPPQTAVPAWPPKTGALSSSQSPPPVLAPQAPRGRKEPLQGWRRLALLQSDSLDRPGGRATPR